jgi:hypothetical protein
MSSPYKVGREVGEAAASRIVTVRNHLMHILSAFTYVFWFQLTGQSDQTPPTGFLIDLLVPPTDAEHRVLAIQTAYVERWIPRYGVRRAKWIFRVQVAGTIAGFWINWIKERLDFFSRIIPPL